MASNVNPNNIDGTYPIAGQDNDSQGFRTNFTNIKNNFIYTKSEIEDLQAKVVVKSALTGTTADNNMAGTIFRSAEIRDLRETRIDLGTTSGTTTLDHTAGSYFTVITAGTITLAFSGFPAAGKLGRVRLEISVSNTAHDLVLPANVTYGLQGIAGLNTATNTIVFARTGTYVFEFITENGGTDVHISDMSRARSYFQSSTITLQQRTPLAKGATGDTDGMIAVDDNYLYVCTGNYDGSTLIWKRVSLIPYS